MRQLEYFCAVCRNASFTRAADELFVSQSAISQQIKALESELGFALIDRHGRTFTLTKAGEHFFRRGSAILEQLEDARFEAEGIANGYATSLTVGYLNRYEGWEVQAAVAAFIARHPRIELHTAGGSHDELYRLLKNNTADLLFSDKRRAFDDDYVNLKLATCYEYVEVSEASAYAQAQTLRVNDLAEGTAILLAAPEQEDVERAYYRDVLNFKCDLRFVQSREEGRMKVAGNRGFMPIELRRQDDAQGSIIRRIPLVDADGTHIAHEYYAFWPKARTNELIEEFAQILAGLFETQWGQTGHY